MSRIFSLTAAAFLCTSLFLSVPSATNQPITPSPDVECEGQTNTGVSEFASRIDYTVTYNKTAQRVCMAAENTGGQRGSIKYVLQVDNQRLVEKQGIVLDPGEEFRDSRTISGGIDATRDNHTVVVSSYNGTFYFNFTQDINTMNEQGVPTPHFENITIKRNGTESGQPRIVLEVENEGRRTYVPEGEVRTLESDSRYLDDAPDGSPGGRYSVRLSESSDEVIVGTARLYGGTFNPGTKFDRVSFVSYPNGTYDIWEPEFEEIPTAREIEQREVYYENESARAKYTGPDVDPISERASRAGAVLVVLLVVGGFWYWRR